MKIDKNLDIWKKGRQLATNVYELAKELPEEEKFVLSQEITQMVSMISRNSKLQHSCTPELKTKLTMRKYIVSIVGRPNVGKSTLFNRLCRKRSAIVDFEAGITEIRKYEDGMEWEKIFKLVDTGGIVFNSIETIDKMVLHQVMLAY